MKKKPVLMTKEEHDAHMTSSKEEIPSTKTTNRWTDIEDAFLLQRLNELETEINYSELQEEYTAFFKVNRTPNAFKVRIQKIAKENQIDISSNNGITDGEKKYICDKIKENPFDIKYNELATDLNCSEDRVKRIYLDLISPEEQINMCIANMNDSIITSMIDSLKHTCSNCNCKRYSHIFIWKDQEYCEECFETLFRDEINMRWSEIHKYSIHKNKTCCNICKKNAIMNDTIATRFHYDHIDMFNKSDSICRMVRTGEPINNIYDEIDKCQLLCASCHTLVTKIEHKSGFIRFKRQLAKEYTDTSDLIKKEELLNQYSVKYNEFMLKVYEYLKEFI